VSASAPAGYTTGMRSRWSLLVAASAIAATSLVVACGDDDDDSPADPTVTLFEGTTSPNVSTGVSD
jgi:hypothetical protein